MKIKVLNPIISPEELESTSGCEMIAQLCDGGSCDGLCAMVCFAFDFPFVCPQDIPDI
ncbi:hypothetical protein JYK00_00235 [Thermosipho ferrireducens]|uniref:Uncharacterized protein n=1 Tax=Thermosipho ferrireducens TaxID=2571116 RepID=A0ABX7S887_9BACT|nr:hypothetical protein [Thermosipho ferrireducens]QTA38015.1 hypothetical protein JYK00_00235 [Thermosipho ferrireducens]